MSGPCESNFRSGGTSYKNHYLYRGASAYEWLAQPGLCYCRARFYLPQHGRFLQPDPIGQAGGLNLYTYCGNDPINGSDPSGLLTESEFSTAPKYAIGRDGNIVNLSDSPGADVYPNAGGNLAAPEPNSGGSGGSLGALPNGPVTLNTNDPAIGLSMGGRGGGGGIGEPGPIGSMIPGYGNGRNLINDVQTGHYGWAAFHGVMLASDAMLLKSLVVGVAKGAVFLGAKVLVKEAAAEEVTAVAEDAGSWIWSQSKGAAKSIRQMNQRGWTPQQVTEAIKGGQQFPARNLVNPSNPAIRYVHPITGQSVVQDTVTNHDNDLHSPVE